MIKLSFNFKNHLPSYFVYLLYVLFVVVLVLSVCFLLTLSVDFPFLKEPMLLLQQLFAMGMPYLFIFFFILGIISPVLLIFRSRREKTVKSTVLSAIQSIDWLNYKLIIVLSLVIVVLLISERFFRFPFPTGGDTGFYMVSLNDVLDKGVSLGWLSRMTSTRFFAVLFSPLFGLGLSSEGIVKVVPVLLGVFYGLAFYLFFKDTHKQLAVFSCVAAVLSSALLVLSAQLFENLLAVVIMTVFFALFVKSIDTGKLRYVVLAAICQFVLLQIYGPAWLVTTGIVLVFLILSLLTAPNKWHLVKSTLKVYSPSILVVIIGPFVFSQMWDYNLWYNYYVNSLGVSFDNIGSFIPAVLQVENSFSYDLQPFLMENSLILLLAISGLVLLLFRSKELNIKQNTRNLLVAWVFVPSLLLPLFSINRYRLALYYPLPLLAAISFFVIAIFLYNYRFKINSQKIIFLKIVHLSRKFKVLIPLLAICLLLLSFSVVRLVDSPLISSPVQSFADPIYWIGENYDGKTTIVCIGDFVHSPPAIYDGEAALVQAITHSYLYVGKLADLLSGNVEKVTYPWVNSPPVLEDNSTSGFTILVLSIMHKDARLTFYSIDSLEAQVLQEVHPLVYELKSMNIAEIANWIGEWRLFNSTKSIPEI